MISYRSFPHRTRFIERSKVREAGAELSHVNVSSSFTEGPFMFTFSRGDTALRRTKVTVWNRKKNQMIKYV